MRKPKIIVAHPGARLHYAVAALFHKQGYLAHFYTDNKWPAGSLVDRIASLIPARLIPGPIKQWKTRQIPLPNSKITAFQMLGLRYQFELKLKNKAATDVFYKYNRLFGDQVVARLKSNDAGAVYGFTGSSLEIFKAAKAIGLKCILEQMSAPVAESTKVIQEEHQRWPGWQEEQATEWDLEKWTPREQEEWDLADRIISPSGYVSSELKKEGLPQERINTVPFAVSGSHFKPKLHSFDGKRPLRILYVGALRLLKGIPYLLEALSRLDSSKIEVVFIGQNYLSPDILKQYHHLVDFKGQIPRNELARTYHWADIFVMPSLCEGSATVNYEARACGLPSIATFTSGTWITDGVEGCVVPRRSSEAIAEALEKFLQHPELVEEMSKENLANIEPYTWDAYGKRLVNIARNLVS